MQRRRPLPGRAGSRRGGDASATTSATAAIATAFLRQFEHAVSPGFDPDVHLAARRLRQPDDDAQLGVARDRRDVPRRRCATATATTQLPARFRAFDTICSATQDRQDAVIALLDEQPLDLMIVIGGYNSSNTCNLARICAEQRADLPHRRSGRSGLGRRRSATSRSAASTKSRPRGWLPAGPVAIGLTSGASTPDNLVEAVIRRLDALANRTARRNCDSGLRLRLRLPSRVTVCLCTNGSKRASGAQSYRRVVSYEIPRLCCGRWPR